MIKLKNLLNEQRFDTLRYKFVLKYEREYNTSLDTYAFQVKDYHYEYYGSNVDQNQKRIHDTKYTQAVKKATEQFKKTLKRLHGEGKFDPTNTLSVAIYLDGELLDSWERNLGGEEYNAYEDILTFVEEKLK